MESKNKSFVTINGKECREISVFDHGLLYGDGVFDTFRVFNKKAFMINEHINRLFNSAEMMGIMPQFSKEQVKEMVKDAYNKSSFDDAFIRIIITCGVGEQGIGSLCEPNVIIMVTQREFIPLKQVNAVISEIRRTNKNSINPKIKSLNYGNLVLAAINAKKLGADEAILLNESGKVAEATTSNVFIVKNGKIITPSIESGILEGITRKAVIENFPVTEKSLSPKEIMSADEVFLTGTANFVTIVKSVNNRLFNTSAYAEKVFEKLMELTKSGEPLFD